MKRKWAHTAIEWLGLPLVAIVPLVVGLTWPSETVLAFLTKAGAGMAVSLTLWTAAVVVLARIRRRATPK